MRAYATWVLRHRYVMLGLLLAGTLFFALQLSDFGVDVGSSSLILEDDPDLKYYDLSRFVFGSDEYVIVCFRADDVFHPDRIRLIDDLSKRLKQIPGIADVLSLTTVRLFRSPRAPGGLIGIKLQREPITLAHPRCDVAKARQELLGHAGYVNNIVSADGKVTSVIAYLEQNERIGELEREVHDLDARLRGEGPAAAERAAMKERRSAAHAEFLALEKERKTARRRIVDDLRSALGEFSDRGVPFQVSGVPFILVNMMEYIELDVILFGVAVLVLFFITLFIIFRRLKWVILPLIACAMTVIWVMGLMALLGKDTTIVTSNISSLLMVIAMAHSIYLIMQFGELRQDPSRTHEECVAGAVERMARPCFFVATAAVAGFGSLLISHIKPVMDFGAFMSVGVFLAFVQSFLVFPAGMGFLRAKEAPELRMDPQVGITLTLARWTEKRRNLILAVSLATLLLCAWGATYVRVEARFIDYFKPSSALHQGLTFIDQQMGGTTSLEIVLSGPGGGWFHKDENLARIRRLQDWLAGRPEVGKVLSVLNLKDETAKVFQAYTGKEPSTRDVLSLMVDFQAVDPATLRSYLTSDGRSTRVFVRMRETSKDMVRSRVIAEVREFLAGLGAPPEEEAHITGIYVLYTNLLESLVGSQLRSLTLVFFSLLVMLWILFRSFWLAVIGMIPNTLPMVMVFGAMGWLGIHLDMATVMVASVSLGFAVDPAIQYVIRYRDEVRARGDWTAAMYRANASIGRGIFYTCITIIIGFWVLVLSQFKPTLNFGLITGIAMAAALIGSLTGLPLCMILFKPIRTGQAAPEAPTAPAADGATASEVEPARNVDPALDGKTAPSADAP